jgi:hypothetical protein
MTHDSVYQAQYGATTDKRSIEVAPAFVCLVCFVVKLKGFLCTTVGRIGLFDNHERHETHERKRANAGCLRFVIVLGTPYTDTGRVLQSDESDW